MEETLINTPFLFLLYQPSSNYWNEKSVTNIEDYKIAFR